MKVGTSPIVDIASVHVEDVPLVRCMNDDHDDHDDHHGCMND